MELIKQSQWAKRHGFSRQYAGQLVQSGVIQLVDGLVDVEQADSAIAALRDPNQPQRRKNTSDVTELSTLLLKTRIKNEMERGKLLEARAKAEIGELVSVEDVKVAAFNKARIVRDSLMNIPDRVASLLASIDNPHKIHEALLQEIRTALEELSRDV
jgi:multidrug efflux pump subunit AcrA (membrane-fusion protein)